MEKVAEPNVFTSPQMPASGGRSFFKSILKPKFVFSILALLLILEGVIVVAEYFKILPKKSTKIQQVSEAKFELLGPKSVGLGESVQVKAMLSTGRHTVSSADLVLKYDPTALEASPSAIVNGKIFKDYPITSVDQKNGIIRVSAATKQEEGMSGTGIFATITFKAKRAGETQISVDFKKDETKDSNILDVLNTEDILQTVNNLRINVQ